MKRYRCPITKERIKHPVVAADGFTYEKQAIVDWINQHACSPVTHEQLSAEQPLYPNALMIEMNNKVRKKRVAAAVVVVSDDDQVRKRRLAPSSTIKRKFGNVSQVFDTLKTGLKFKELKKQDPDHPYIKEAYVKYYEMLAEHEAFLDQL
jgi:hypothetical protein